jgi:polyisoprenoid-binding protein YceI
VHRERLVTRCAFALLALAAALGCGDAGRAPKAWALVPTESSLAFVGTKNESVGVPGSFTGLAGEYDAGQGTAFVEVSLAGANTGDPARDENIRTHFFEAAKFPLARFEVKGLPAAPDGAVTLEGTLSIHGASVPLRVPVQVTHDEHHHLRVRTVAPLVLSAEKLGMATQLATLKTVCGHQSLADTVPVEVDLAFEAKP